MRTLPPLLLAACAGSPLPDELTEPTAWLFGHLDDREDDVAAQVAALGAFAAGLADDDDAARRTWAPARLDPAHTDDVDAPALPAEASAIGLASLSTEDTDAHRALEGVLLRDCLTGGPVTAWSRTFEDGGACFPDALCDDALTADDVRVTADDTAWTLPLRRQLRAVVLEDGGDAVVSRAWHDPDRATTETAWFELDVWLPDADDPRRTVRAQALWTDLALDAAAIRALLDARQRATESVLDGSRACPGEP